MRQEFWIKNCRLLANNYHFTGGERQIIQLTRGTIQQAAIIGGENFDVNDIDQATVRLEGIAPDLTRLRDRSGPVFNSQDVCDCTRDREDGFDNLLLSFHAEEILCAPGDITHRDELVPTLTGELNDGTPIKGQDCLLIIDRYGSFNPCEIP